MNGRCCPNEQDSVHRYFKYSLQTRYVQVHSPVQPGGTPIDCTSVPSAPSVIAKVALQMLGQWIPDGSDSTRPPPTS